ncbi:hypothetical protein [Soonwooa sp.]|uniref:hypothetical protein n=1 Tax=Soonwooa sp. TaxID=1938592 RepID=UPI002634F7EB|nr:hypothetical protein [Soonwooa sp.]
MHKVYKDDNRKIFEFKNVFFKQYSEILNIGNQVHVEIINCRSYEQTPILFNGSFSLLQIRGSKLAQIGFSGNITSIDIVESEIGVISFSTKETELINNIRILHPDSSKGCNINFNNVTIDNFQLILIETKKVVNHVSLITFGYINFIDCRDFIIKSEHNKKPNCLVRDFFISDKEYSDRQRGKIDFRINKIVLSDLNFNRFKMVGDINSTILIKNIKVQNFELNELVSIKKLVCNNLSSYPIETEKSSLKIKYSNLSNIIFSESNFDAFDDFIFEDNYINTITFDSCTMPSNEKIIKNNNSLSIARNFKNIFKKQEDKHLFLQYLSLENNLQLQKSKLNWKDKTILYSSKFSNNFGINPLRGVLFTMSFSVLFFTLSILSTNLFEIGLYENFDEFKDAFSNSSSYFWQFILPTHRFDYLGTKDIYYSSGFYFWDFIGRIFVGFGIYQTIAAFRKYSS